MQCGHSRAGEHPWIGFADIEQLLRVFAQHRCIKRPQSGHSLTTQWSIPMSSAQPSARPKGQQRRANHALARRARTVAPAKTGLRDVRHIACVLDELPLLGTRARCAGQWQEERNQRSDELFVMSDSKRAGTCTRSAAAVGCGRRMRDATWF